MDVVPYAFVTRITEPLGLAATRLFDWTREDIDAIATMFHRHRPLRHPLLMTSVAATMEGVAYRTTTIDQTTSLTAAPPMVFAVVNSPETAHLIDPAVREWSPDSRPIVVGTRFTIRGRLGIVPIRGTSQVIVWDPPRQSEFRSVAPAWPVRMTARHRFDERSDGGTEYTWSISFEEVSFVARPVVAILRRLFRRAFAAQAEALESYVNQRAADDPTPPL